MFPHRGVESVAKMLNEIDGIPKVHFGNCDLAIPAVCQVITPAGKFVKTLGRSISSCTGTLCSQYPC
jgi:hypothetical protein